MLESFAHSTPRPATIQAPQLQRLFELLRSQGYTLVGPRVRDGAIVYDEISGADELPRGWTDVQEPGAYRLERRNDGAYFGFSHGPQSWKRFLFTQRRRLWSAEKVDGDDSFTIRSDGEEEAPRFAFIGVRPCELAAIAIQDRVFINSAYGDPYYAERRERALLIAVNCTAPAATCFCTSFGTGPAAERGFDLALTELIDDGSHRFLVQAGSRAGELLLADLRGEPASEEDLAVASDVVERSAEAITRRLETRGLHDLLVDQPEHRLWNEVATRCLSCGNCTLVCPTCFCSTVEDVTDLAGDVAERWQTWDSCFTADFSYIHGGPVRSSVEARYRQWMTHKLATWVDQFGTFGCVGCGRCITWCPVGIDITQLAAELHASTAGADALTNDERSLP
jgi:sulfhydrogenase subunit beta (sulfur reductase)